MITVYFVIYLTIGNFENKLQYIKYLIGIIEEVNPFNIMSEPSVIDAKKKSEEILKKIVEYNYDRKYIIVKSLRNKNELFWIINKELPIDSVRFTTKNEYEKELRLKGI